MVSQVPDASAEQLRMAGANYPKPVTDKYLGLPASGQERTRELGKALFFVASKAGEALGPVLKPAGSLTRGVASLDPASIIVAGLLLGGATIAAIYGRRYVARKRRKPDPKRSVKVSDARSYSRYGTISAALAEAGVAREGHETPEEFARRAAEASGEPGVARLGDLPVHPVPKRRPRATYRRVRPAGARGVESRRKAEGCEQGLIRRRSCGAGFDRLMLVHGKRPSSGE